MRFALEAFSILYKSLQSDMGQTQLKSKCSHDMIASRVFSFWCFALLIVISILINETEGNSLFARRRQALNNAKKSVEESTESTASVAVPDQIALAATDIQRRKDYNHERNYELNLIRPEKEPRLHAQITAKYSTSITSDHNVPSSLEDTETAEEYVAKAVQKFGTRLKEPIRIMPEQETSPPSSERPTYDNSNVGYYESATKQESVPEQQQQKTEEVQQPDNTDEMRAILEAQFQAHLQEQEQQQQQQHQFQLQQYQAQQYQAQQAEQEQEREQANIAAISDQTAPNYESIQRKPYETYEEATSYEASQPIERTYRTKHIYQPSYRSSNAEQAAETEKIRVSASTEIPKAEIMKQIEKSVIKYMQELEAEGKIITAPKEPKTYYKVVTVPVEEKRVSSTTVRPKYVASTLNSNSYATTSPAPYEKPTRYIAPKLVSKQPSRSENSAVYHSPSTSNKENSESFGSNVEFVYKIKSRAPLQTATVKTVSKPYTLPYKTSADQFDHSAVLKNMEEFDLSHVVSGKEPEERLRANSKPSKLYFNSEIYQDINSLPYKGDKSRLSAEEYHKLKEAQAQTEYKGYSGYFAEPASADTEKETGIPASEADEGYPIMNPYQYVLKKEPVANNYDENQPSAVYDQSRNPAKALYSTITAQKALEYENFNTKFGGNSDSYGYPIAYKTERERDPIHIIHKHAQRHAPGKRGKRGGTHHAHSSKKAVFRNSSKDVEASLALRPPPKV